MTFTDAAIEVLRLLGKPLHYKEITDLAIERNLLSHVGKSPEVTMGARLAALMKKEAGDNPLVRVKPGVFALRDWDAATVKAGLDQRKGGKKAKTEASNEAGGEAAGDDESDDDEVLLGDSAEPETTDEDIAAEVAATESAIIAATPPTEGRGRRRDGRGQAPRPAREAETPQGPDDAMRAAALGASEIFDEEEDDDEPILGGGDDAAREGGAAVDGDGRRRRRRRRRGRSGDAPPASGGDGLPAYTATPVEGAPREAAEVVREVREPRDGRDRGRDRNDGRDRGSDRGSDRGDRGVDRGDRGVDSREVREAREGRGPQVLDLVGSDQLGADEIAGRDMADVVATLLGGFDRGAGPVSLRHLAEALQRRARGTGDAQLLSSQIAAAIRADNARRASSGQRPRFRFAGGRVGATDWLLGADLLNAEREALAAVERYREAARRAFARRVSELPGHAFVELVVLALETFGIAGLRAVRRPGGSGNEAHFAGRLRGPGEDFQVAVAVRRDGREIGRERVTELRGALHHYGAAQAGFLFTSGQVLSGAREEAASAGAAPVALHDGASFARLCEEHEVAVVRTRLPIAMPDIDLLEALRAS